VETVGWEDLTEVDVETLPKEDTEDTDVRFSTFIIFVIANEVCSWITRGIVFKVENLPLGEIIFWGARREKSSLQKIFAQSDSLTH
jgi:hypothetical protein